MIPSKEHNLQLDISSQNVFYRHSSFADFEPYPNDLAPFESFRSFLTRCRYFPKLVDRLHPNKQTFCISGRITFGREVHRYLNGNCCCLRTPPRKIRIPTSSEINGTGSKHIFLRLDCTLTLTVSLRMKGCAKVQLRAHLLLKPFPKPRSETSISIRDNRNWHPVSCDNFL